ncbi:hypothetical protein RRG08_026065 [Elysia crispata]|uniref:Uncharacterized protein n=1 Tax=Elysia crispata TaxID=231223 RepID=A0AAE0YRG4_9GAST|nr:hypothetical protein RRG08_026065 [Elysia crispata]
MMLYSLLFVAGLCISRDVLASQVVKKEGFQFLLLAHFWPATSCVYFQNEGKDCYVSPDVKGWTIHGFWPSIPGTEKPDYCNNSMKFNFEEIKGLSQRLAVSWPYFEKGASKTELWEHEWTKHGTCAYTLPILKGELRYFNQTLNLHDELNISKTLGDSGICPSNEKKHTPLDFFNAVKKGIGKIPNIICLKDKKTNQIYLDQIWLCYNKQLQPMDCPDVSESQSLTSTLYFQSKAEEGISTASKSYFQECPKNEKIYFNPIPRE